ncbi:XdhC family protein [Ferruginibacter sp. HRS2-29]|uniref:XdhC family protein n=1 Tax=Ferruginibacter sp. HRS2-29 TaxID=2487334 RepID=UPI0020CD837F|nr:XdhC/CoxI family protein [Ferruginibacter sp. HRS2-29]MCP9750508.1 XdhC/CoxI family protein [Ferruginibacter sp. HRS2-29]
MKEINDIIRAYKTAQQQGLQTALATVVHVEGSSYRRPGARMLIEENGRLTGAISGGCLEGDALRKALLVMHQRRAMLVTYDTMDEDDAKFGVGLGCNGIIQVLIEPILSEEELHPVRMLQLLAADRVPAILVTVFSIADKKNPQPGTFLLQKKEGVLIEKKQPHLLKDYLQDDIRIAFETRSSSFKTYVSPDFNLTAFIEFVPPPVSLIIAGAGNDVVPLVNMAHILGWQTTVIDGRPAYAKAERFTSACNVMVLNAAEILQNIPVDEQTVFLLMTHNYNYDLELLTSLLSQNISYIGILGPKKKWERIVQELKEKGIVLSVDDLEAIHSPAGLDIGAETPEEIALSILPEIKAALSKRTVVQLKDRPLPIHVQEDTSIHQKSVR